MERDVQSSSALYDQLGGMGGVRKLADTFYDTMSTLPKAKRIREMHPEDLSETRENLTLFLCGWLGGPPLYREKFGSANLVGIHVYFDIGSKERDMWLHCMELTLEKMRVDISLRTLLLERFRVPAEKIRQTCAQQLKGMPVLITPQRK